ncbi:MAG: OmpA family protein [Phaeodactylibacter sp.]|nr:OmpA family protein [Phaeodactylibacter sp.]
MRKVLALFAILSFSISYTFSQDAVITLNNPSFEDTPRQGIPPQGWQDCGFDTETPPDVQPSDSTMAAFFEVTKKAFEGDTYLGMVVRDNETWEKVSQRLSGPLEPGQCYEFSIYLCRSELYVSQSRSTFREVNYTTPARLRIWGGSGYCKPKELLGETTQIINTRWLQYNFRFKPTERHTYIMLEAFYNTPTLFPYNGNVLVDNASPIVAVPCDPPTEPMIADNPSDPEPKVNLTPPTPEKHTDPDDTPDSNTETAATTPPAKEKIIKELDRKTLRTGQTIKIDKLFFEADSSKIKPESFAVLDEIYEFLDSNKDVKVEIGGHTNGIPEHAYCDMLSTARARAVAEYLKTRGIDSDRLSYRGYGKRDPIASNATPEGRRRNQRVEIKILSFDG